MPSAFVMLSAKVYWRRWIRRGAQREVEGETSGSQDHEGYVEQGNCHRIHHGENCLR